MKINIYQVALSNPSLTIRFSEIFTHGVLTKIFSNRRLIATDSVSSLADLKKLVEEAITKLSEEEKWDKPLKKRISDGQPRSDLPLR